MQGEANASMQVLATLMSLLALVAAVCYKDIKTTRRFAIIGALAGLTSTGLFATTFADVRHDLRGDPVTYTLGWGFVANALGSVCTAIAALQLSSRMTAGDSYLPL
jgi:hypothetical protein